MEMTELEKVIRGLRDIDMFIAGRLEHEKAKNFLRTIDETIMLLKVQERKKGSWDYGTQCSVCKGTIVPPWKRDTRVNFCPWCGADMRDSYEQKGR